MTDYRFDRARVEEAERFLAAKALAEQRQRSLFEGDEERAHGLRLKIEEYGMRVVDLPDGSFWLGQPDEERVARAPMQAHRLIEEVYFDGDRPDQ